MELQPVLSGILIVLGAGFLLASARLVLDYVGYLKRRRDALLTWPGPPPPYYGMRLGIGVVSGFLAFYNLVWLHRQVFGETMMFMYYGYLVPLSRRIGRGFYADGIWADTAFIAYADVGGLTWKVGQHQVTLIIASRLRNRAWRLDVPGQFYAEARRLLRDKISAHTIQMAGTGLDLGGHDERDSV